jgi:hypothetical protein
MSTVAVFLALGGVSAYAANEWTGANIVDGSLTGADVFDNTISGNDITNNSVTRDDVKNGSLTGVDLANLTVRGNNIGFNTITGDDHILDGSISGADITDGTIDSPDLGIASVTSLELADGTVTGTDVSDNSLNGSDINESTLVGVKDVCHAGAVLRGRLCAGSDGVARSQNGAFDFCESIGLRLPTLGEAKLMARNYDAPGAPGTFWTDSIVDVRPNNLYLSNAVAEDGVHIALGQEDAAKTVCVETPTDLP